MCMPARSIVDDNALRQLMDDAANNECRFNHRRSCCSKDPRLVHLKLCGVSVLTVLCTVAIEIKCSKSWISEVQPLVGD